MRLDPATFAVHTRDGQMLGQVEGATSFSWSRELNEVSQLSMTAGVQAMADKIIPWYHWVTCWHGQALQWTGPIIKPVRSDRTLSIAARDVSKLMWATRTQLTRQWQQAHLGEIAADMWQAMLDHHRIRNARPMVLAPTAENGPYSVSATADQGYVHQDMAKLATLGLRWTVHRGRPVLGTQPVRVAVELDARHLAAGVEIHRSGERFANDVRLQGQNFAHTEYVPVGDLRIQSIVSLNDLRGVSNITKAGQEQAARSAMIRDELVVPPSSTLTPDAPIELTDLVPGIHIGVSALGLRSVRRVDKVEVTGNPTGTTVAVTLSTPENLTEIEAAGGTVMT